MADEITNKMLLEHIQGMKNDLQEQIRGLRTEVGGIGERVGGVEKRMVRLEEKVDTITVEMHQGFEDARLHRQALQEDLEATMRVQGKHAATLSRISHPRSASS